MSDKHMNREKLFGSIPDEVHARLNETLLSIQEEEEPMKKARLQPVLVIVILLILCGVAVAAVTQWDVLSVITRKTRQGETVVNEELAQLAQDLSQMAEGEYLRITMSDALFDGRMLIAAWEIDNLSDDTLLYVMAAKTENSVDWDTEGGSYGIDEYLPPNATHNGGIERRIYDDIDGDTMHIGIHYQVLTPAVDVEYVTFPDWQDEDFEAKAEQHEEMLKNYNYDGRLLVIREGEDWLYNSQRFQEELNEQYERLGGGMTRAEEMIATGKFVLLEEVEIEFDLQITERPISFLPGDEAAEHVYDDFTMRIIRADKTPSTVEMVVEAVFTDEELANQYQDDGHFSFIALNAEGNFLWDESNFAWGANSPGVLKRGENEWVLEYIITYRELITLPKTVIICPAWTEMSATPGGGFEANHLEGVALMVR